HLERRHGDVALADPGEGEQGLVLLERPGRGPDAVGGARGDVERRSRADPELLHAGHELVAELEADLAKGGVARLLEAQRQRATAGLAAEVLERVVRLREVELGPHWEHRLWGEATGAERDGGGDDLERRPGWEALAVGAGKVGLVGVGTQQLLVGLDGV